MRKLIGTSLIAAAALAIPLLSTSPAQASLEACGNINIEANAQCKATIEGGCEAQCSEFSFEASCAAKGYASCKGKCDLPSVNCSASCEADCQGTCESNPNFDCEINCQGACDADCSGHCSSSPNRSECEAQCKATCKGECGASCNGSPVSCEGKCKGSCQGQCSANTRMQCQVGCQAELSASCQAEMKGGCEVACEKPEGALVCDGEYVDHGGNAQECLNAIEAWSAQFNAYAEGDVSCSGNSCEAEASAGCGSTVANAPTDGSAPYAIGFLGALGALAFGRFRRRQK